MNDVAQQYFFSPTKGTLVFSDVLTDILQESQCYPDQAIRISVGTDSEEFGSAAKYVTIIHLWRVGHGARAYRTETTENFSGGDRRGQARFRQRIWKEILMTAMLAQELRSALRDAQQQGHLDAIEVHADVGARGGSSVMIREVIGVLKGYGFADAVIKLKPDAYAASAVADHYI